MELTPDKTVHFATTFQGNYYEASHYCRRHCMQLISINSQAEQKALEDYLKRSRKFITIVINLLFTFK